MTVLKHMKYISGKQLRRNFHTTKWRFGKTLNSCWGQWELWLVNSLFSLFFLPREQLTNLTSWHGYQLGRIMSSQHQNRILESRVFRYPSSQLALPLPTCNSFPDQVPQAL